MKLLNRINERTLKITDEACWLWDSEDESIPIIREKGKNLSVRAVLWTLSGKELPEGRQIRMTCRNRKCVRPEHMRLASGNLIERLFGQMVISENGCWVWVGSRDRDGYGLITWEGTNLRPHRVSYEHFVGEIQENFMVCHHCDNPSCFNPTHLFQGTNRDNSEDMCQKGRSFKGETHHSAKLTPDDVRSARNAFFQRGESMSSLAARYDMSFKNMDKAVRGVNWKHVKC